MSLINEALKRARLEAARQDAAEKGVPPAALPAYVPPRRRSWMGPVVGFVVGLLAVGVAAGAFWLAQRPASPESNPQMAEVGRSAPVAPHPTAPAASPATREAPAAAPTHTANPVATGSPSASASAAVSDSDPTQETTGGGESSFPAATGRPAPAAAAPPQDSGPPPRKRGAAAPPPATAEVTQTRASTPEPSDEIDGQTYLRQAQPAGGQPVKVGFIVWSEAPFAQVNGQLLSPGQSIDGYTLLTVERDRVELEGAAGRFWLRVK